jgi:hypothetical protein
MSYNRAKYLKYRDTIKKYRKEHYNPEYYHQWYLDNKERIKQYRKEHTAERKQYDHDYYQRHKFDKILGKKKDKNGNQE